MDQLILLGGMSRSGANMLGNILDSHSEIACGPDTGIIDEVSYLYLTMLTAYRAGRLTAYTSEEEIRVSMATLLRGFYAPYAARKGKKILVDRTLNNIWSFPIIAEILPEAKFVHLIRDGRDVACSQLDVGKRLRAAGHPVDTMSDATLRSVFHCAAVWAETVRFGWDQAGPDSNLARDGRAFTTFYENIVISPESQIRNLCDFIGVAFAQSMLYPERQQHDTTSDEIWTMREAMESPISILSAGRWIDHLPLTERILFYARGHVGLRVTGYDDSVEWLFRGMNMPASQAVAAIENARQGLLGIAESAKGYVLTAADASPARVTIEKIIAQPVIEGAALGKPLPEIDALIRTIKESGNTFIGG